MRTVQAKAKFYAHLLLYGEGEASENIEDGDAQVRIGRLLPFLQVGVCMHARARAVAIVQAAGEELARVACGQPIAPPGLRPHGALAVPAAQPAGRRQYRLLPPHVAGMTPCPLFFILLGLKIGETIPWTNTLIVNFCSLKYVMKM